MIKGNFKLQITFDSEKTRDEKTQIMINYWKEIKDAKDFKRALPLDFKAI